MSHYLKLDPLINNGHYMLLGLLCKFGVIIAYVTPYRLPSVWNKLYYDFVAKRQCSKKGVKVVRHENCRFFITFY